jgi:hypothetical protein
MQIFAQGNGKINERLGINRNCDGQFIHKPGRNLPIAVFLDNKFSGL